MSRGEVCRGGRELSRRCTRAGPAPGRAGRPRGGAGLTGRWSGPVSDGGSSPREEGSGPARITARRRQAAVAAWFAKSFVYVRPRVAVLPLNVETKLCSILSTVSGPPAGIRLAPLGPFDGRGRPTG